MMKTMKKTTLLRAALLMTPLLLVAPAWSEVPMTINYQGKLTNNGVPQEDKVMMIFSLHDALTDGNVLWTESRIVDGTGDHRVTFTDGIYSVQLGSVEALTDDLFDNSELYLEVQIFDGTDWITLEPRQQLTSTAFAVRAKEAETLQGFSAMHFTNADNLDSGTISNERIGADIARDSEITWGNLSGIPAGLDDGDDVGIIVETDPTVPASVKDGIAWTEVALRPAGLDDGDDDTHGTDMWADSAGQVTTDGKVGIGTTSPNAMLEVSGGIKIADDGDTCDATKAGTVRWHASHFLGCNGNEWVVLDTHNGIPVVYSAGEIWMDRNLGAASVAQSFDDEQAYGDLYQWGRGRDGHEKRNSPTTSTLSSSDDPGHGRFITVSASPYDWRSPRNDNLWQGESGINNPCPAGFRLPTITELETERFSWSSDNYHGAFNSPLKLVAAGYRIRNNGSVSSAGSYGFYWSCTVNGGNARYLNFSSDNANTLSYTRAHGFSARCLED